jgi:transposase-like protein
MNFWVGGFGVNKSHRWETQDSARMVGMSPQMYQCPYCKYSNADVNRLRVHAMTQHSVQPMLRCPLCQDMLNNKLHLQLHLTHLHSVAPDCVEKLIMTVRPMGAGPVLSLPLGQR